MNQALPVAPNYLALSETVRERMARLKEREVVLEVRNMSKRFKTKDGDVLALKEINFKTHRREFVCVIGPSGCGKSTLIRILAGLESASSGEVLLDGKPVTGPGSERGMVFQGYTLFPWLTVKKNVMFGPEMNQHGKFTAEREARQWLELVGLEKFADVYPHQLSGGMKQRVAIARALVNQPRILLMDEPFGALDAQTRLKMQTHLLEIWKNIDITILFITHDLDEAIFLADRILVLKANPGEVAELIEVNLERPRGIADLSSAAFMATKARLTELIHAPVSEPDDGIKLHPVRMVDVSDKVE